MAITFKRAGQEAVALENVSFKGVALDKVTFKRAGQEAVTVFVKITQLATPQNVTADGTVVSWDEVENATSYEVLADGTSIGTVDATPTLISFTINGTPYQAESGMTWQQWVDSSYNTATSKYYINSYGHVAHGPGGGGGATVTTDSAHNNSVSSTDIITATAYYYGQAN